MNTRPDLRGPALLSALGLGLLADLLIAVPGRPGLNIALWATAGVLVLVALQRRSGLMPAPSRWLVGGALGFAVSIALRDTDALAAFGLLASVALLVLAAASTARASIACAEIADLLLAGLRVIVLCAAGPFGWGRGRTDAGGARWRLAARTVVRGVAIASPAMMLLLALLMAADPVFAGIVRAVFVIDPEPLVDDLVFIAVAAWITSGYLRTLLIDDGAIIDRLRLPAPGIAPAEIAVGLWLLNLLFGAFMAVQLRYLFGGADLVDVTAGLGYADYARQGFFELVAATAVVLPLLLLADWLVAPGADQSGQWLRASMRVLVVLLFGVIASAAYRMWLYQQAYGLTELRVYASVFIVWLSAVFGWLLATVLRGRRDRFAFGAMVAGLACVVALQWLNPHAVIVRVNVERAVAGAEVDSGYLATLSADAVPALVAHLHRLPAAERCEVERMLVLRWAGDRPGGWRTWNLGDWRARRLLADPTRKRSMSACPTEQAS